MRLAIWLNALCGFEYLVKLSKNNKFGSLKLKPMIFFLINNPSISPFIRHCSANCKMSGFICSLGTRKSNGIVPSIQRKFSAFGGAGYVPNCANNIRTSGCKHQIGRTCHGAKYILIIFIPLFRWKYRSRMHIPIGINANSKWPFCRNRAVLGPFKWMKELYKKIAKGMRVAQFAKWNAERDFGFWNQSPSRNYWEEGK